MRRLHLGAALTLQGDGCVGRHIGIYWPLDECHYPARILSFDPYELRHMVMYDADGVKEYLNLWREDIRLVDESEAAAMLAAAGLGRDGASLTLA